MMNKYNYPSKYELLEVLNSITNRTFLNVFAQKRGIFITNTNLAGLADEIANLYLDNDDIEQIRREAYHIHSNHALSGFTVKSSDNNFDMTHVYQWIYEQGGDRKVGQQLSALVKIPGEDLYKASFEYNRKKAGRIEFLQDEVSSFDFYFRKISSSEWQVEIDSNRSTDLKELKELIDKNLRKEEINEIDPKFLNTEISIKFFDELTKSGMDDEWNFVDIKHLNLKKGNDDEKEYSNEEELDVVENVNKDDIAGITQAILQGKNLREDPFVQQCVTNSYRFNAMTYEFHHNASPHIIHIRAEFKGRPKVFEVSIAGYEEVTGIARTRTTVSMDPKINRHIRSTFWNNSKDVYNKLIHR